MTRFDTRFRRLLTLTVLLMLATLVVACGGGETETADASSSAPPPAAPPAAPPVQPPPPEALALDYQMVNQAAPMDGIVTGGQPTDEDLEKMASRGFQTVISLRTDGEPGTEGERQKVEALGMRFVQIPIAGADDLDQANAEALAKTLADPDIQPLLLHCGSSNRVGALVALEAFYVGGKPAEEAFARGQAAGLGSLESVVHERLGMNDTD